MLFLFHALLTLNFGFCTENNNFDTKTVTPGEDVTLACPLRISNPSLETLYWIRLVSGNWPELLGATFNFRFEEVSKKKNIHTKQEKGEFLLHINKAQINDTGLYYCIRVRQLDLIFMNGTFLLIKEEQSNLTVFLQKPTSGSVHPENPATLQCSVLSESERKTCPADNRVYWFRTGSANSHPNLLYVQENSGDECEKSHEAPFAHKCFYNFSETFDAATYYCAAATCGEILFGNGANLHDEANRSCTIDQ